MILRTIAMLGLLVPCGLASQTGGAHRRGFWWSFGPGYGAIGCPACEDRHGVIMSSLTLGGTISPSVLAGVTSAGVTRWLRDATPGRGQLLAGAHLATVRLYPAAGNAFLETGIGLVYVSGSLLAPTAGVALTPGASLGAGRDVRLAGSWSVGLRLLTLIARHENGWITVLGAGAALTRH